VGLDLSLNFNLDLNLFLELIPGKLNLAAKPRLSPSKYVSLFVRKYRQKYPE
jgi:hypothetical protein